MDTHPADRHEPGCYEIRLQGRLDDRWSAWFADMTLTTGTGSQDTGVLTVLRGPVADQAALHGLLARLRDLGLPLLSVTRVEPGPPVGRVTTPRTVPGWPVPLALLGLSVIPVAAGTLRLLQLAGGPAVLPADDRFAGFPAALVVHIVGAAFYVLVGAFQFVPGFRRTHLAWHRRTGRVLAVAGLLVAGSALWMTLGYARKPGTGEVLFVLRLLFASAMAACLVLGVSAVRSGDLRAHRAWMIRAYAIALAAGTQAFTEGISGAVFGTGEVRDDLAKGAGWVLNLAVAEWAVRRPAAVARRTGSHGVRRARARCRPGGPPGAGPCRCPR